MGLVLNRFAHVSVAEALSDIPNGLNSETPLFWGGPVQSEMVLALFRNEQDKRNGLRITRDLFLGNDLQDLLQQLQESAASEEHLRVFAGYAGWGAGQLACEMEENSWILTTAKSRLIFNTPVGSLWTRAMHELGPHYAFLATMPEDPRVN